MPNSLKLLGLQLREIWRHIGINQKISTTIALVITLTVVGGLLYWSSRPDYRLLYSGLSLKDAGAMQEKLEENKVSVELKDSGRAIYVPAKDVYRSRLLLASLGLPKDNSTGFELFEQPKFGLTDFAQQVNYQRALQGELERTITSMNGIEAARVMLVMPKEKLFSSESREKARGSVLLTMSSGMALSASQVQSIVQLVGSSVPGLSPSDVTISDQNGKLLTRATSGSEILDQGDEQLAVQQKVEGLLTGKAQDMLDLAIGKEKSIVRVSVAMDFTKTEKRIENYKSDKVVKSETIESENTTSPSGMAGGPASVTQNIPVNNPAGTTMEQGMSKLKKENVRTEYAIPSDVQQIVQRGGRISSVSVSVCLAKTSKPRDLKAIEEMVRNAVGLSKENAPWKGDVKVTEMEFPSVVEQQARPPVWWQTLLSNMTLLKNVVVGLVLLVTVYLIGRRVMANLEVKQEEVGIPLQSLTSKPYVADELARRMSAGAEGYGAAERNIRDLHQIAEQNPKAITAWISSMAETGNG